MRFSRSLASCAAEGASSVARDGRWGGEFFRVSLDARSRRCGASKSNGRDADDRRTTHGDQTWSKCARLRRMPMIREDRAPLFACVGDLTQRFRQLSFRPRESINQFRSTGLDGAVGHEWVPRRGWVHRAEHVRPGRRHRRWRPQQAHLHGDRGGQGAGEAHGGGDWPEVAPLAGVQGRRLQGRHIPRRGGAVVRRADRPGQGCALQAPGAGVGRVQVRGGRRRGVGSDRRHLPSKVQAVTGRQAQGVARDEPGAGPRRQGPPTDLPRAHPGEVPQGRARRTRRRGPKHRPSRRT